MGKRAVLTPNNRVSLIQKVTSHQGIISNNTSLRDGKVVPFSTARNTENICKCTDGTELPQNYISNYRNARCCSLHSLGLSVSPDRLSTLHNVPLLTITWLRRGNKAHNSIPYSGLYIGHRQVFDTLQAPFFF